MMSWDNVKHSIFKKINDIYPIGIDTLTILFYYRTYQRNYRFLKGSENWSKEQIESYQTNELIRLIKHAYNNVPYYTKLFNKLDLKPEDIKTTSDLEKIPILTKEIARQNISDLKAKNYHNIKFSVLSTSGSTGDPFKFYITRGIWDAEELAYAKIIFDKYDISYKDKFVILRGYEGITEGKNKFCGKILFGRGLIISPYYLNEKYLPKYIELIRNFKPKFISSYPSTMSIIAKYMKENKIESFSSLKVLMCGSEMLFDWQQKLFSEVFQCKIIDIYGLAESVASAISCENSNYFHFFPQYGIVELIDKDGKPVTNEGQKGEIVATGFRNYIFPFIRYKTGDIGINTNKKCICGSNYKSMKKIEGRTQDYLVDKNNNLISLAGLRSGLYIHYEFFNNIKQFQFYQEKKGEVFLNLVKNEGFRGDVPEDIKKELQGKLGDDMDLIIKFTDEIPRTVRGRYKYLVQKIPISIETVLKS